MGLGLCSSLLIGLLKGGRLSPVGLYFGGKGNWPVLVDLGVFFFGWVLIHLP